MPYCVYYMDVEDVVHYISYFEDIRDRSWALEEDLCSFFVLQDCHQPNASD